MILPGLSDHLGVSKLSPNGRCEDKRGSGFLIKHGQSFFLIGDMPSPEGLAVVERDSCWLNERLWCMASFMPVLYTLFAYNGEEHPAKGMGPTAVGQPLWYV